MPLENTISEIETLKANLETLPPIQKKDKQRLWEKFQLEWNYNSNHIEGNTLTIGETLLLLIKGKTTGDHDKREYDEMEAHDVAVEMVKEWAKDKERPLTELDIRELNRIILVRPFFSPAQTADGQPTRKKITPGKYKELPNHVLLPNGKIFRYAEPNEVPAKMQALVDWYNNTKDLHPVIVAAKFHHEFVLIHPFGDGNGRVARLIMNYHLLKNDYPPIIIKSSDKKNYLNALNKADAGEFERFADYIGQQLCASLDLKTKATKGESIEEQDDFDKELELWKRKFQKSEDSIVHRTESLILERYFDSFKPFVEEFIQKTTKISELFMNTEITGRVDGPHNRDIGHFKDYNWQEHIDEKLIQLSKKQAVLLDKEGLEPKEINLIHSIGLAISFNIFKHAGTNVFNIFSDIYIQFEQYKYIMYWNNSSIFESLYSKRIPVEDKNQMIKKITQQLMETVDKQANLEK